MQINKKMDDLIARKINLGWGNRVVFIRKLMLSLGVQPSPDLIIWITKQMIIKAYLRSLLFCNALEMGCLNPVSGAAESPKTAQYCFTV